MIEVGVDFSAEPGQAGQADKQARLARFREQRLAKAARLEAVARPAPRPVEPEVPTPESPDEQKMESSTSRRVERSRSRQQRKEAIVDKGRIDEHDEIRRLMAGDKDVVDELARRGAASVTKSKDRQR